MAFNESQQDAIKNIGSLSQWSRNDGIILNTTKTLNHPDANFLLSLVVLEVKVVMTTFCVAKDDKVGIMTTPAFQWLYAAPHLDTFIGILCPDLI